MYIRSASSPSTILWAFHTIQPSSYGCFFLVFILYFLTTGQEIVLKAHLRNDLICVEWDVKP